MNRGDIVGALKTFATSKGWHFIFGNDEYVSSDRHDYEAWEVVLTCLFQPPIPKFNEYSNVVQEYTYTGSIMIGRKFEIATGVTLNETMGEKYDNRLLELSQLAINKIRRQNLFVCCWKVSYL